MDSPRLEPPDADLVTAVLDGDLRCFETLFDRYRRQARHTASHFFDRRDLIEDAVQTAFIKAYCSLRNFRGARDGSFASWICQIVANICLDEVRRHRSNEALAQTPLSASEIALLKKEAIDPEAALIGKDAVQKLFSRLPPEDRIVLGLLEGEGRTVTEIAQLTGWSTSKIKLRAFRARRKLRRLPPHIVDEIRSAGARGRAPSLWRRIRALLSRIAGSR